MKQLLILSGKGGTGKTTIASSFISLLKGQHKTCFADCDVDVPNLHLIFSEGQTMLSQKPALANVLSLTKVCVPTADCANSTAALVR